ncbi:hypothetical protein RJ641_017043 [Dillenia turbinata]|uniref:Uncharacterized protein n=1 Tax=Dillenia turbinata TaxID=194707 RepID=A0AAN8UV38_9MAGN
MEDSSQSALPHSLELGLPHSLLHTLFYASKDPSKGSHGNMGAFVVGLTYGAGQIGYALVPLIARGAMLGPDQPVILQMLDIEPQLRP